MADLVKYLPKEGCLKLRVQWVLPEDTGGTGKAEVVAAGGADSEKQL
eukprot:gene2730-1929_t